MNKMQLKEQIGFFPHTMQLTHSELDNIVLLF